VGWHETPLTSRRLVNSYVGDRPRRDERSPPWPRILDSFPGQKPGGRVHKYDWPAWTALDENGQGQVIQITRGEDFTLTPDSMRMTVASRASAQGLRARTTVQDDTVTFQFYAKDEVAA
jgi:hypothetical protein